MNMFYHRSEGPHTLPDQPGELFECSRTLLQHDAHVANKQHVAVCCAAESQHALGQLRSCPLSPSCPSCKSEVIVCMHPRTVHGS